MQDTRKRQIRIEADSFREKCRVGRYGIIDLFSDCERAGYILMQYPLGVNADLGFTLRRDQDIIIFTNSCSRLSREIFTLAHEIGHAVIHLNGSDSFVDTAYTLAEKNTDDKEQEANYFAANLLMPTDEVDRFLDLEVSDFEKKGLSSLDVARMMSAFNVSFDTVLNRLESMKRITAYQRVLLGNERNERKVGNLLRSVGGNSRLNEASHTINLPHEFINYVIYNYNHHVIPEETLDKALSYYQLSREDVSDLLNSERDSEDNLDSLLEGLKD